VKRDECGADVDVLLGGRGLERLGVAGGKVVILRGRIGDILGNGVKSTRIVAQILLVLGVDGVDLLAGRVGSKQRRNKELRPNIQRSSQIVRRDVELIIRVQRTP
jgi:3-mercaptopyruvate sulfurtransferase SseA